jgi:hypothetical protein
MKPARQERDYVASSVYSEGTARQAPSLDADACTCRDTGRCKVCTAWNDRLRRYEVRGVGEKV